MAEAELHKERLQAIAVSPLSFYFLALLSGMQRDPSASGHRHSSTVAHGACVVGMLVCQGSAMLLFLLQVLYRNPQGSLWAGDSAVENWLRNKMLATGLWGKTKQTLG